MFFAILFLLMNRCKKETDPKAQRACESLRHNWLYHRYNKDTWDSYLVDLKETNDKLNDETGNKFSTQDVGNWADLMLDWEFDQYCDILEANIPKTLKRLADDISSCCGFGFLTLSLVFLLLILNIYILCTRNKKKLD